MLITEGIRWCKKNPQNINHCKSSVQALVQEKFCQREMNGAIHMLTLYLIYIPFCWAGWKTSFTAAIFSGKLALSLCMSNFIHKSAILSNKINDEDIRKNWLN